MALSRRWLILILAFAGIAALAACSGDSATATPLPPTSTVTAEPSSTPRPTATTFSADSTATPMPTARVSVPTPTGAAATATSTVSPMPVMPTPAPELEEIQDFEVYRGGLLVGADDIALGELSPAGESVDSVCDPAGDHGSVFSETSIFNPDSEFGGPFGEQSPFNPEATSPPMIVVDGTEVGTFSVSPFAVNAVDPESALRELGCPERLP